MRSKTLIAVNDQTFFAVIMPGIKKARLNNFADEFHSALSAVFRSEGFGSHQINALFGGQVIYAKAYDRQALGIINDAVKEMRYYVESQGGWDRISVVKLTKQINRTPWLAGTRHCVFPIDKIAEDLKSLLH